MKTVGKTIEQALKLAKILDRSEPVDGEMFATARQTLEDMLADWQSEFGIDWIVREGWLTLTPGQSRYFFGPDGDFPHSLTDITSHTINDGMSDVAIEKTGITDYRAKPNKAHSGRPVEFASSEYANGRDVYFWPTPDRPYVFAFSYRGLLTVPDDPNAPLGVPVAFDRCIRYNLAMDLMTEFGVVDQKVDAMALELKRKQFEKSQESGAVEFVLE